MIKQAEFWHHEIIMINYGSIGFVQMENAHSGISYT